MRPPPSLTFAALALWGWQVGLLPWAILVGALLEGARRLPTRLDPGPEGFRRLWNVTTLIFVGVGLGAFFAQGGWGTVTEIARDPGSLATRTESLNTVSRSGLTLVRWLPLVFFPFLLVHSGSRSEWLPWTVVSPYLNRRLRRQLEALSQPGRSRGFHPAYPYFVVVLFAASAGREQPRLFFPALVGVIAWALWNQRSARFRAAAWATALGIALAVAWAGRFGVSWSFQQLQSLESRWLREAGESFDPLWTATDIGAVGRLKQSGRIVMRVWADDGPPPSLLREATYTHYRPPFWNTVRKDFQPVVPQSVPGSWRLTRPASPQHAVTISRYGRRGRMAVALPSGAFAVENLPAEKLETNRLVSARAEGVASLVEYTVHYAPNGGAESPPGEDELELLSVPEGERETVSRLAAELGLPGLAPRPVLERVRSHFLQNFEYSLELPAPGAGADRSPLARFLFHQRRGHCEYFATATTLLLRTAGIPTRYAVGYSVQEARGGEFVVRARHAHAWCLAFVDGRWEVVDNTPGVWSARDAQLAGWWEPIQDRFSGLWRAFSRWRQSDTPWRLYVFVVAVGILLYMAARELRGARWRRAVRQPRTQSAPQEVPGRDSEFYAVEAELARAHTSRPAAEPVGVWLERLRLGPDQATHRLRRLTALHYRLRFDPAGLPVAERAELRTAAVEWVREQRREGR
jgi:transglutaminase-like putative cysteine protease